MNTPLLDPLAPVALLPPCAPSERLHFQGPLGLAPLEEDLSKRPEPDEDELPRPRELPLRREEIDGLVDRVLDEELERLRDETGTSRSN